MHLSCTFSIIVQLGPCLWFANNVREVVFLTLTSALLGVLGNTCLKRRPLIWGVETVTVTEQVVTLVTPAQSLLWLPSFSQSGLTTPGLADLYLCFASLSWFFGLSITRARRLHS
jgi:hypothetical protein